MNNEAQTAQTSQLTATFTRCLFPCVIVSLGATFYLYEYFLRVMPTVITSELAQEFRLGPSELGQLLACFFYAYAAMQVPAGLICDHIGPKRSLILAISICALSTFLFQQTEHYWLAQCTRFAIGAASAFAFVCPLKLADKWFSADKQAMITGLVQLMGCFGAIFAQGPIAALVQHYGWRTSLFWTSLLGLAIACIYLIVLQDQPKNTPTSSPDHPKSTAVWHETWQRFRQVISVRQNWAIGITAFAVWSPIAVFAESWGIAYLCALYNITPEAAAGHMMWVWIAMAIASPTAGWLSNYMRSRKVPCLTLLAIGLIASSMLILAPPTSAWKLNSLLFLLGVASAAQPVTFGMIHDNSSESCLGTAIAMNNMLLISSCSVLQPIVGILLEWLQPSLSTPITAPMYQNAFLVAPLASIIGMLVCHFCIQETHCQKIAQRTKSLEEPLITEMPAALDSTS